MNAQRLRRWAQRARDWADEAERLPNYKTDKRLRLMAEAKRRNADHWEREARR